MIKHFATIMDKHKINNEFDWTHSLMHIKTDVHTQNNGNIYL